MQDIRDDGLERHRLIGEINFSFRVSEALAPEEIDSSAIFGTTTRDLVRRQFAVDPRKGKNDRRVAGV
jgi:hypothetical protein